VKRQTNWLPFCGFGHSILKFRIKGKVISKSVSPPAWIKFSKLDLAPGKFLSDHVEGDNPAYWHVESRA